VNRVKLPFGWNGVQVFDSLGFIDPEGRGADYTLPTLSGFVCQPLGDLDYEVTNSGTYQYKDTLTKVAGTHTLKFGAEMRRVYSNNYYDFFARTDFSFNITSSDQVPTLQNLQPGVASYEVEDMTSALLGLLNSQSQTQFFTKNGTRRANDEMNFRQPEYAIFAQDEWKVLPNLSLTYGLRWEYYAVPYEANGNLANLFQDPVPHRRQCRAGGTGSALLRWGRGRGTSSFRATGPTSSREWASPGIHSSKAKCRFAAV
jgi:outer membrane receptor protein involved in Fe transport